MSHQKEVEFHWRDLDLLILSSVSPLLWAFHHKSLVMFFTPATDDLPKELWAQDIKYTACRRQLNFKPIPLASQVLALFKTWVLDSILIPLLFSSVMWLDFFPSGLDQLCLYLHSGNYLIQYKVICVKGYVTYGSDYLVKEQSPVREHKSTFSAANEQHRGKQMICA